MNNAQFELIKSLQYSNKALKNRLKEFETGDKYVSIKANHKKLIEEKNREIKGLKIALAESNIKAAKNLNNFMQASEDMEKEHLKELHKKDKEINELKECLFKAGGRIDELLDERKERLKEMYAIKTELDDEKEKNHQLLCRLSRDFENSSVPSSQSPNRKKIENSREKTGNKQGAQPGHKGHGRKKQPPARIIEIPVPAEYLNNPEYAPTGKIISKQVVNIAVDVVTHEYRTLEFRHKKTRRLVHADFPEGVINDVNYGGSVKAFAFLLNNNCNVSIDKTKEFLSAITNGRLEISRGMINGLSKEFSNKTKIEQEDAFSRLLCSSVMGIDFTTVPVNGEKAQVLICANAEVSRYYAREHKGHAGVKGSPAEHCQGTLVHDHDKTFYSYGKSHQECLAHILRYLKASMENEPDLKWNTQMWMLIREMLHYRNELGDEDDADICALQDFKNRYLEILNTAKEEYEYVPPSKYYRDGYNLQRRLLNYIDSHLLFLHDKNVPANNNLCERLLRILKRKAKQSMTFRSFESLEHFCDSLGTIAMLRSQNENLYSSVASIFS